MSLQMSINHSANILILDDLPFRRACIANLLKPHYAALGYALSEHSISSFPLTRESTGVALLVIGPETNASNAIQDAAGRISDAKSDMALAALATMPCEPELVRAAFHAGALAFLTSDMDPSLVLRALDLVAAGGTFCSPAAMSASTPVTSKPDGERFEREATSRQQEVMRHLREGLSNKSIARRMMISEATVKIHIRHIMRRMGVHNRTQVALHSASADAHAALAL